MIIATVPLSYVGFYEVVELVSFFLLCGSCTCTVDTLYEHNMVFPFFSRFFLLSTV